MVDSIGNGGISEQQEIILQYLKQLNDSEKMSKAEIQDKDSDGDGMLSLTESGLEEDVFIKSDSDGDGLLTQTEIAADIDSKIEEYVSKIQSANQQALQSTSADFNPSNISANIVDKRDKDGDGMVSESETRMDAKSFKAADADGDGLLSADEIASYIDGMMQSAMKRMGYTDKDASDVQADPLTSLLDALNADEAKREESAEEDSSESTGTDTYSTLDILA